MKTKKSSYDNDFLETYIEPFEEEVKTFTKNQFIKSNHYESKRDILNALLDNGQRYSVIEVNNILDEFYGGTL